MPDPQVPGMPTYDPTNPDASGVGSAPTPAPPVKAPPGWGGIDPGAWTPPPYSPGYGKTWVPNYAPPKQQLVMQPIYKDGFKVGEEPRIVTLPAQLDWVPGPGGPTGGGGSAGWPAGQVSPKDEYMVAVEQAAAAAKMEFTAREAELDRTWKSAEASKDRELQRWVQEERSKLEREKMQLDGWLGEMRANVEMRGQNVNASIQAGQTAATLRGQDVAQRGQEFDLKGQILGQQAANQRFLGEFGLNRARLGYESELGRRGDTRSNVALFGYANPNQYGQMSQVMAPTDLPNAPDFSGFNADAANAMTRPRVSPIPQLYPEDITGGLGPKLNLPPHMGTSPVLQPNAVA